MYVTLDPLTISDVLCDVVKAIIMFVLLIPQGIAAHIYPTGLATFRCDAIFTFYRMPLEYKLNILARKFLIVWMIATIRFANFVNRVPCKTDKRINGHPFQL